MCSYYNAYLLLPCSRPQHPQTTLCPPVYVCMYVFMYVRTYATYVRIHVLGYAYRNVEVATYIHAYMKSSHLNITYLARSSIAYLGSLQPSPYFALEGRR